MSNPKALDDELAIPDFLLRKNNPVPKPTTVALPVAEILARERQGDRPTWQAREDAIKADRKAQKLKRLSKLTSAHPGMRWNPKKKQWVPTFPRKRRIKT